MVATKSFFLVGIALALAVTARSEGPLKKVSHAEAVGAATAKVAADYPQIARQLKLEGKVEVEAVVNESGTVDDVNVISGNPVLTKAATLAVKKWKFTPFTDGGKPVKVLAPISLSFKL